MARLVLRQLGQVSKAYLLVAIFVNKAVAMVDSTLCGHACMCMSGGHVWLV